MLRAPGRRRSLRRADAVQLDGPAEHDVDAVREAAHVLGIPGDRVHHEAFSFHSPDTYSFERTTREP